MEDEAEDEDEEDQFVRACGIVTEVDTTIFRIILHCQLPTNDCIDVANKIRHIGSEQLRVARNVGVVGHYDDCDMPLMYFPLGKGL